ncbi:hypothetical protein SAMN05216267_1002164 [Actinacidiphila rubida]|uniref:Uncharacterized protein n=1 Tax=Actinacidiphila rubida TaxID=310780 RepID=A0A1H8EGP0_9ACTN|nr:hypothetical protein SAMN05216267_1002164 [Actinacidiphila rubida]
MTRRRVRRRGRRVAVRGGGGESEHGDGEGGGRRDGARGRRRAPGPRAPGRRSEGNGRGGPGRCRAKARGGGGDPSRGVRLLALPGVFREPGGRRRGRRAQLRLLAEHPQEVRVQLLRRVRAQVPRRDRGVLHLPAQHDERVVAGERRPARQQFVQRAAQGVDVGGAVRARSPGPFRGQVATRPEHRVGARGGEGGLAVVALGDAEVRDLHRTALARQQVGRLDVPVDHTVQMGRGQPGGRLRADLGDPREGQRPLVAQFLGQGAAAHPFHHQEGAAVLRPEVVHAHDARVVEPCGRARLVPEAGRGGVAVRCGRGQHLDGHGAAQAQVPRPPDLTHRATSQWRVQSVAISKYHGTGLLTVSSPATVAGPGHVPGGRHRRRGSPAGAVLPLRRSSVACSAHVDRPGTVRGHGFCYPPSPT